MARLTPPPAGSGTRRAFLFTASSALAGLVLNLATGILTARVLEPSGRGLLSAAIIWASLTGYVSSLGQRPASAYSLARHPGSDEARSVPVTALAVGTSIGVLVIALVESVVPAVFSGQGAFAVQTVRVFLWTALIAVWFEVVSGVLAGLQLLGTMAAIRLLQPMLYVAGLVALVAGPGMSVRSALAVHAFSNLVPVLLGLVIVRARQGLGRPTVRTARRLLSYGRRVHLGSLATESNSRLDLFVLPRFDTSSAVGCYSVASNASYVLQALIGNIGDALLPIAAARDHSAQRLLLARTFRLCAVIGLAAAATLTLLAGPVVHLLYGPAFSPAIAQLQILVPGAVSWSLAIVLAGGLQAAGLPGRSSGAQGIGLMVTIAGLVVALPVAGAIGAAVVSSIAYTATLLAMMALTPRDLLRWRDVGHVGELRGDVALVLRLLAALIRPQRSETAET